MVVVSYSGKEINAKLVYYGPGLCGKTTNLEHVYDSIPSTHRGKMVSMKTRTERTLFFDFLPVDLGELGGFKTRFLLYTVPGQVYYNATRKLVLRGVDAVVFVADSARGKMNENLESLENLRENLREYGLDLATMPWVLQFNKRDLPDTYTIEEMNAALNPGGIQHFEAVATNGTGVFETLKGVSRLLLDKLSREVKLSPKIADPGIEARKAMAAAEPKKPGIGFAPAMPAMAGSEAAAPAAPSMPAPLSLSTSPAPPALSVPPSLSGSSTPAATSAGSVPSGPSAPKPAPAPSPSASSASASATPAPPTPAGVRASGPPPAAARSSAPQASAPQSASSAMPSNSSGSNGGAPANESAASRPGFGQKLARMFGFGKKDAPFDMSVPPASSAEPPAAAPAPPRAAVVTSGSSTRISRIDPAPAKPSTAPTVVGASSPARSASSDAPIEKRISVPVSLELTAEEMQSGARLKLILDIDLSTMQATVERDTRTGTR